MIIRQLENKNQFYLEDANGVEWFQSYSSLVAKVEGGILSLGSAWDYSHTTLKHLYIFLLNWVYCKNINDDELRASKNKRAYIQHLIDIGEIKTF